MIAAGSRRRRALVGSLVAGFAVAVLLAACRTAVSAPEDPGAAPVFGPPPPPVPPPPPNLTAQQSRRTLEQGLDAYEAEDYASAVRAFRRAARGPEGVPRGRALYMLGLSRLALAQHGPARDTLLRASREYAVLGDHALYYAGKAALAAGDDTDGVRILSQLRLNYLNSVWRADAARLVGITFLKIGNPQEARKALARALGEGVEESLLPATRLAFGEAHEKSDSAAQAVRVYRDLWLRYPETREADVAGARFTSILRREGHSPPYTSYQLRVERASRLYSRFSYEKALEAYRELARETRSGDERYEAAERAAHCLFRLKRYPEATRAFASLREQFRSRGGIEEAAYWEARSVTREGRFDEAIAMHIRLIERHGRSRWARESRYRLALLLEDRGRLDEAVNAYGEVVRKGTAEQVQDARWRLGWIAWKQGRTATALENFRILGAGGVGQTEGRRGMYWSARVHEREGRRSEALPLYRTIVRGAPLSYYRFAAEERLEKLGVPPEGDLRPLPPLGPRPPLPPGKGLGAHFERGLELARLRQNGDAARELELVQFGSDMRMYFARLFLDIDDNYQASRMILSRHAGAMSRDVTGIGGLLRFTYPPAYHPRVVREAARQGIDPRMVWSVMREESTYRPRVLSPAGAVGLMQIIPATAARIAPEAGIRGTSLRLEDPGVNIKLGSYYLGWLMKRYGRRTERALAGYNAGEEAVDRWLGEMPASILAEKDAFIEEISYRETQGYVKKVLKSYGVYRRLYPDPDAARSRKGDD